MTDKKKIVILGAGFGGLKTAQVLNNGIRKLGLEEKYEISLIDRNNYHTYYPTLYEIATTSKNLANQIDLKKIVTIPLADIFMDNPLNIIQTNVAELDLIDGDIH